MEDILEIKLFGDKHKIKTDEDMSHARFIADFLENEVAGIEREVSGKPSGLNHFVKLLMATLNISNEYIKLKHGHGDLEENVSDRYLDIVKRIATDLNDSDSPLSSFSAISVTGSEPPVLPDCPKGGAGFDKAASGLPELNGETDTGLFGSGEDHTDQAVPSSGDDAELSALESSLLADIDERDADELLSGLYGEDLEGDDSHEPADDEMAEDAELSVLSACMLAHVDVREPEALPVNGSDGFQVEAETDENASMAPFGNLAGNTDKQFSGTPVEKPLEMGGGTLSEAVDPLVQGPVWREKNYDLPPLGLLDIQQARENSTDNESLQLKAELLEAKLNDFGVKGEVTGISPGPVITTFEYKPAAGVKISKIVNLSDDLALALSALSIRIVAPIPGRDVVGIEIPNVEREIVSFRDLVDSPEFRNLNSPMGLCLGKDIVGTPVVAELNKMPHLLIAGATGTGKSVGLNAMITSILYKASPDEVKFIMIDPKRIELSFYNGIPHLISPVVTDMKKATNALFWAVREMERRYGLLAENKVRNVNQYNRKMELDDNSQKLPFIVIIIDELADLMMTASRDVEVSLARLAQMARAAGIHMILATQRPSVDVLTGTIKANFPTRISFQVSSKIDSRTIIDTNGAETLLGNGDMLFVPPGTSKLARIHGAYISEEELIRIIEFVKDQQEPEYNEEVTAASEEAKSVDKNDEYDERYDEAVALVTRTRQASISSVQRHLRIGYNRSARIIEMMESNGIVGPPDGAKGRNVLVQSYDEME